MMPCNIILDGIKQILSIQLSKPVYYLKRAAVYLNESFRKKHGTVFFQPLCNTKVRLKAFDGWRRKLG